MLSLFGLIFGGKIPTLTSKRIFFARGINQMHDSWTSVFFEAFLSFLVPGKSTGNREGSDCNMIICVGKAVLYGNGSHTTLKR